MGAGQEEAQHLAVVLAQRLANRQEVAERLGHLVVADAQCPAVHPNTRERNAECAFALRDLVFVVREDQIGASAVNVEGLTQRLPRHRRALDMPARAARAPG